METPGERPAFDKEVDLEAGQQDLVERPDDQLVLADGKDAHVRGASVNMTKPPLYAAAGLAASLRRRCSQFCPLAAQTAADARRPVCACVPRRWRWIRRTSASLPAELDGMEVFVRVTAGRRSRRPLRRSDRYRARRVAGPSLLVSSCHCVAVRGRPRSSFAGSWSSRRRAPTGQSDEVFAFSLKTRLTALRAAVSSATQSRSGIAADAATLRDSLARRAISRPTSTSSCRQRCGCRCEATWH